MIALMILGAIGAAIVTWLVVHGFRWSDLWVTGLFFAVTFFLSRFDAMFMVTALGRPLPGIVVFLAAVSVVVMYLRGYGKRAWLPRIGVAARFLVPWSLLAVLSGLVKGGAEGVVAAIQILIFLWAALIAAGGVVEFYAESTDSNRRVRLLFMLAMGIVTPAIMVATALAPGDFGRMLGWRPVQETIGAGFVRGWSPIGSTITSGALVVLAYALLLHEYLKTRRVIFAAAALLNVFAVMFTLARSVLIMFMLVHFLYWVLWGRRHVSRRALATPLVIIGLVLAWGGVQGDYSFERFLKTDDFSLDIRRDSLEAAVDEMFGNPLLGRGPGLLYSDVRTTWIHNPLGEDRPRFMMIGDRPSAMEPHNLYALVGAEHGIPALLLFVALFLGLARRMWVGAGRGDADAGALGAVFTSCWLAMSALFLTDSDLLLNPQFAFFFWVFGFLGVHHADSVRRASCGSP